MKRTQIIVVGASGRMGREIAVCLADHPRAEFYSGVDPKGRSNSRDLTSLHGTKNLVVVEFSTPKGMKNALAWCVKNKVPFVSGTTGIGVAEQRALQAAAKKIPILWSPNMSRGVNIFIELIKKLGPVVSDYDLQLEEFHHKKKVDAPSGTAKILQTAMEKSAKRTLPPVMSGRGGGIFGVHKLYIMGQEETLTIEHTALSRRVFARGAVDAAVWLSGRKPGLYSTRDMLK